MKPIAAVDATLPLPGITRPRGRPRKPNAKTNAERQKAFRTRQKDTAFSATSNEK